MNSFFSRLMPFLALVGVPLLTAVACGTSSTKAGPCVAGQQIACACAGGGSGVQVCTADGTYGACECGEEGGTSDAGSDSATSGDGPCSCGDGGGDSGGADAPAEGSMQDVTNDVRQDSGPLTGSLVWAKDFGGTIAEPGAVASDSSGNILLVGSFTGTVNFGNGPLTSAGGYDIFVIKLDPTGHTIWSKNVGDSQDQVGRGIGTDSSGNVLLTCGFSGSVDFGGGALTSNGGPLDICLAKLDSAGNYVWAKSFGDTQLQQAEGLAVDSSGNILIDGLNWGSVNFGNGPLTTTGPNGALYLAKFDPSGAPLWSKIVQNTGNSNAPELWRVAVDASGNALFAGAYWGSIDFGAGALVSAGKRDVFLAKFGPSGTLAWAKGFGDALGDQEGTDISADGSGNLLVTGNFDRTIDFGAGAMSANGNGDIFLAKLDPSGNAIWSKHFGDATSQNVGIGFQEVAADAFGNPTISGGANAAAGGNIDFGGGPLVYAGDGSGAEPFVAKFDASGGYAWAFLANSYGGANALATDPTSDVLLAGTFSSSMSFAAASLSLTGTEDTFLLKLTR